MSITPEGGLSKWEFPHAEQRTDSTQLVQNAVPERPHYRSGIPTCKICDSGTLRLKEVHRLSGPAVVIGFILLIPSVLGIFSCVVMLIAFNTSVGSALGINANISGHQYQSDGDEKFRKNCKDAFGQVSYELPGTSAPQYCECMLAMYKRTDSLEVAGRTCADKGLNGTLEKPSKGVAALYSGDNSSTKNAGIISAVSVLGNAFLIGLGIAFFVSGLLGWLLVMKKRVLQCDVCGAVVNAS